MHWKRSILGRVSRRLKGKSIAAPVEQLNGFAARQTYRLHDRILSNPGSRRKLRAQQPSSDAQQQRVIEGLETRGVSVLPFADFFPNSDRVLWERLRAEGAHFAEHADVQLAQRRAKAASEKLGKKDYIFRLLGRDVPILGADDPWLELGISDRMLEVVNSYLGLWSKLTYVDLWYTAPAAPAVERVSSQRWHRDYNDKHLVKVFIYLTDVDEGTGPLEYVPGSALGGEYAQEWPWRPVSNDLYPPQDELERRIPESARVSLTGAEGTMIFCNTSGFHRGGYATGNRPRVMAVYNYSSPASLAALTLRNFNTDISRDGLSEQAAYALA